MAVRGEIVVQFWLKPGEAAVTLGPGEEQWEERIPAQLRRFLGSSPKRAEARQEHGARMPAKD